MKRSDVKREVSKMSKKNKRRDNKATRKEKVADKSCSRGDVKADKFKEGDAHKLPNVVPKTDNQALAVKHLTSGKDLVVLAGNAGSGKTYISCWWAAKQFLDGNIDKIIITRPNEVNGKDGGAVPGTDLDKLRPLVAPMLENLYGFLGYTRVESLLGDAFYSTIEVAPIEKVAGRSIRDRTVVIGDELQLSQIKQMRSLTTRTEEGCQLILLGDPKQAVHGGENGLSYIVDTIESNPLELDEMVGVVKFTKDDCVRGGLAGAMVRIFDDQGPRW